MVRSQFNNLLWIRYIVDDNDGSHLKEFAAQPLINQVFKDKKLLEMLPQLGAAFKAASGRNVR